MKAAILFVAVALSSASAQVLKFPPSFDKLAEKAEESVNVTLDSNMLQLAGKFLSGKDADEAKAKRLVSGLKGIFVRSFQFAKEGEYSVADVDSLRAQVRTPEWSKVVDVRSKGEATEVYFRTSLATQIGGLVIISAEPKEITIVEIDGAISPEDLKDLSGQFGIPKVEIPKGKGKE